MILQRMILQKKKTTTKNFYVLSNYVVFTIVFCTSLIEIFNRNSLYITFTIAFLRGMSTIVLVEENISI